MSSKLQNASLAVLAVGVAALYGSYALRAQDASAPADAPSAAAPATAPAPPFVAQQPEPEVPQAPVLAAEPLSEGLFDMGMWRGKPALADLDGDGHLDLIAALRRWDHSHAGEGLHVWLGDGKGRWTPSVEGLRRDMGYGGSCVADVDGDGHLDIAYSGHDVTPQLFRGDGHGHWSEESLGLVADGPCLDVAVGDVDGDGTTEYLALGMFPDSGGLYAFSRDDEGHWNLREQLLPVASFGSQVRLADLDGDGRSEVLAATDAGPKVWRVVDGRFVEISEGLRVPEVGGSELTIAAHDFDGDGVQELLTGGMIYPGHVPLQIYRLEGEHWVEWGSGLPDDEAIFDLELADVTGDGKPEIVGAGRYGISITVMTAPGEFERRGRIADTVGVFHVTAGDVNGDGRADVVYCGVDGLQVLDVSGAIGGAL